jgi:hypothetical protein
MSRKFSRQEMRERLDGVYQRVRDKYLPADESQPVKDGKFWEWEQLADEFDRELTAAFLEALAGLSSVAALDVPGSCPFCASSNTKWLEEEGQRERQSKHGAVVVPRQVARCRPCGRSFSPSGAAVGTGPAGAFDPASRRAGGPGGGGASL